MGLIERLNRLDDRVGVRRGPGLGDTAEDQAVIAAYRERHPSRPVRGESGGGGLIGWANRLDTRVGEKQGWIKPRSQTVPIRAADTLAEMLQPPVVFLLLGGVAVVLVLAAMAPEGALLGLFVGQLSVVWAAGRARRRRLAEMRSELGFEPPHAQPKVGS